MSNGRTGHDHVKRAVELLLDNPRLSGTKIGAELGVSRWQGDVYKGRALELIRMIRLAKLERRRVDAAKRPAVERRKPPAPSGRVVKVGPVPHLKVTSPQPPAHNNYTIPILRNLK